MGLTGFLLTYLLGGVTFLPLVVAAVLAHAYYTFPHRPDLDPHSTRDDDDIVQPGDDTHALREAQQQEKKRLAREAARAHHESDVAAGYFAVCREYAPMGINAKPIERSTPVGSATVAAPSQSVYQTMYRSLFDRGGGGAFGKQTTGGGGGGNGPLLDMNNKNGPSQRPRKAGNVFYVVLRHGHIMLFDDDEQLEVRHVVSLAHHDVSIFSGDDDVPTPEGELYIKKNAICLRRRGGAGPELGAGPDGQLSKPFYLFSENCSAKEDFYFSLLRNQEQSFRGEDEDGLPGAAPRPRQFKVEHVISLVQRLHSSEDLLQTRWLNAVMGRLFLGVYGTKDVENAIREKLSKKISRVKRPSFLSNISIGGIEMGDSAPYVTNPRLRDLTVEGECGVEADVKYTGGFRIEVAATARIDLGARFKAREVNLVLAVVLRKLEGHVLVKIKPPPSNRIWFSFQTMPKMETTVEPVISSRQITYTVILRQIEARIKEVVAETLVLPFWDDIPFFNTEHKKWRGGIFEGDDAVVSSVPAAADFGETTTAAAAAAATTEMDETADEAAAVPPQDVPPMEKSQSMPALETPQTHTGLFGRKINGRSGGQNSSSLKAASSTSVETKASVASSPAPRTKRSGSLTEPPSPTVGTDATTAAEVSKPPTPVASDSPATLSTPAPDNASQSSLTSKLKLKSSAGSTRSTSSKEVSDSDREKGLEPPSLSRGDRRHTVGASGSGGAKTDEDASSSASIRGSIKNQTGTLTRNFFLRHKVSHESLGVGGGEGEKTGSGASSPGHNNAPPLDSPKRNALLTVTNAAAATAKRWGLNALQRGGAGGGENNGSGGGRAGDGGDDDEPLDLSKPMGGGQPLPPPGTPLPMPDRKGKITVVGPRRGGGTAGSSTSSSSRPAPPAHPHRLPSGSSSSGDNPGAKAWPKPLPVVSLSKRRQMRQLESPLGASAGDRVLVVEAPAADSEPTTPSNPGEDGYMDAWAGDEDEDEEDGDDEGVSAWTDGDAAGEHAQT